MTEGQIKKAQMHLDHGIANVHRAEEIIEQMREGTRPISQAQAFTARAFIENASNHLKFVEQFTSDGERQAA